MLALVEPTPAGEIAVGSAIAGGAGRSTASVVAHSPLNPGPLSAGIAGTFRGGSYTESVYQQTTRLYRVYGGRSGQLGSFWSRTPPTGPLRSQIDLALNPQWGNTASQVVRIDVPAGVRIYEGFAAPQGGLVGGGSQVFVPNVNPAWIVR
jgi:filamentous hemagglutinin